jgi:hypothetical protein
MQATSQTRRAVHRTSGCDGHLPVTATVGVAVR